MSDSTSTQLLVKEVAAALAMAQEAAEQASAAFSKRDPRFAKGCFADCGHTWIEMVTKHGRFRNILKSLDAIRHGHPRGTWRLNGRWTYSHTQSSNIKEAGCNAACKILEKKLGKYAEFFVFTRLD